MRRMLASLAAFGVVATVAACGSDATPAKTWATEVCRALSPWRASISQLNSQAAAQMKDAKTPVQTRDNMIRLFDGARDSTESARVKVAAAGVPDVDGGKVIANRFVSALAHVRDAYDKAHHTVAALPTSQPKPFYDGVAAAVGTLDKEYSQAGLNTGALTSTELREEFEAVPECG
ncbi:hypothetical protein [Rugosimonospora africana]|nr:hypothetical protein [Rugosimonospora africana]